MSAGGALGRYWGSAERAVMVEFDDCVRNEFHWADGAMVYQLHDTKDEALEQMRRLGFAVS